MRLDAGCTLSFETQTPTPAILMLRPRSGLGQWILREEYIIEPSVPVIEYTDSYGNLCQRMVIPEGRLHLQVNVCAETSDVIDLQWDATFIPVENLPDSVLQFLLSSRYCPSDQMSISALANQIASGITPGYGQVQAIRNWIQSNIEYRYGTSDASTSAMETVDNRVGVCRDFAHLGIALCRSLDIPARMVVGYLYELEPMDLHAWFEAFVGNRWYTFDSTQQEPKGNRISIAYGRDAADVALVTQFGPANLIDMKIWVSAAVAASQFSQKREHFAP
jgi:transglutaminase-like putative cysteine protease